MAAHRFPRTARLTRPADFQRVFRRPVVSSDACFRVLACRGKAPVPRLGMAVSRRVERTSVGRNRIKRIVRESFRHRFSLLIGESNGLSVGEWAGPPVDFVVLPRPGCATISNARLFRSLEAHWTRLVTKIEEHQWET